VRLDQRPVRCLQLGERHVDVEASGDEADPDLGGRLEMRRVDDIDLLDPGAALADLLRIDHEGPDLLARCLDRDGAFEMHAVLRRAVWGRG
jgi:hypothetical protein